MHPSLAHTDHRPWPLPKGRWTWRQSWRDLLFAHWPVPVDVLRPLVPSHLDVQEFDGRSWVGVVPFRMAGVMLRPLPDMPGVSAFPELNVRLYVEHGGRPGVWFLSLDAANTLAVFAGRQLFHLPYHRAAMSIVEKASTFEYESHRAGAHFIGRYRPTSDVYHAEAGTLEHWLTERYCLYAQAPNGTIWRNDVHHVQWPLQRAEATIDENTMLEHHGLSVSGPPAQLHFARRVDVVVWNGERVVG